MANSFISDAAAASNLFGELLSLTQHLSDYREAYRGLNRVFMQCLNLQTRDVALHFGGPFAQTDYLLKEHKAPLSLRVRVNDARVRLRRQRTLQDATLQDCFWHDAKAIGQFISFLFQQPVPESLAVHFPDDRRTQHGLLTRDCLRVIVNRWDDHFLYATTDELGAAEVQIFYGGTSEHQVYKDWDWQYLRPLLTEGCQLNLVRPRQQDGILYPELLILEPDYLADISAIAACFESYGTSYLNHLVGKLRPSPNSQAIVLGNLASQFLDESLYLFPGECSYQQSVHEFFKNHAMSLLTADLQPDFHHNALFQKQNIHHIIHEVLPAVFKNDGIRQFDSSEIIVEPSFFSEMLGIQGRMDFLQLDQKILIEQKSGKAGYPEHDPPQPQEKHYVQLLLYLLLLRYNHRARYEQNGRNTHSLLLYSRYQHGLVELGFAPELVFRALQVRNELVAHEFRYAHDIEPFLRDLTADDLNLNHCGGVLWQKYQQPQLQALLEPIHAATDLERAYYFRFLTFLQTEQLMAKVGGQKKENAGFADKWHSTLEEKLLAGNIYCGLELVSPEPSFAGKVEQVVLHFTDQPDHDISNFRRGDIVILYPYAEDEEPDLRRQMVFRATIVSLQNECIVLGLRASQSNAQAFWHQGQRKWAIEHDFLESSFSSLFRGMHSLLSAPQERRDLLLLQRAPRCDQSLTLCGDYGPFNELCLRVKQARDLFLIIGPPGTGKTSYGLLYALQEELRTGHSPVLLLAYTNRAVDEICSKLTTADIEFIRIGSPFSCDEAYHSSLWDVKAQACRNVNELRRLILHTPVIVGTTTSLTTHLNLFQLKTFSLAIIDEASQILEPHLMGLLCATTADGTPAIQRFILIGDHKQLPAVVQQSREESRVDDARLQAIHLTNCRLSLFERLLQRYRHDPAVTYMLTRQGRMHPAIAEFPNTAFYLNQLQAVPCPHQTQELPPPRAGHHGIAELLHTRRIAFVAVEPSSQTPSDKVNTHEAQAIAATARHIYLQTQDTFSPSQTVGVIVPYRNQIAEVRKAIGQYDIAALQEITIDTVERFQGSQRDYILYGFTIQKPYQMDFLTDNVFEEDGCIIDRKLNVAMTRAREHLYIFGNPALLSQNVTFARLMSFLRDRDSYLQLPLADYLQGAFAVTPLN